MNLPNQLTMLRILLIPFFVFCLWGDNFARMTPFALLIFVVASATDWLDGYLARRDHLVTNFGKLMDPLADKLLVMAAMVCFIDLGYTPAVVVILILAREFLVTSVRLIAAGEGIIIAADKLGKAKTVAQMLWIILTLLLMCVQQPHVVGIPEVVIRLLAIASRVLMYGSVLLTVVSGYHYLVKSKDLILKDK